ncbi:hypothetical protein A8924_1537 [Saccharopolyspora erythraea NRRL 2338]|uniref:Uncharacterized protein n=2 Tax=Saccharopolyspora erythraea TaxID=1836 RepID=A4F8U6_SACEN|nr:hypothetical protein [Saccharopolyspora erythraea]EQD86743.1 hypothetical protein N599_07925 [Saccharopolyspora erythraea D]PFG94266.1 hypothetical protein A8924_1537 [Saccharopolyspora erythraea NRRL 2338]QRK94079.1 hypothetical protein JQX30_06230 [Saccharopolyspora erythraea]CAM00471.1 hypothetical protein SACE_1140 [Saccharopolyspora erythraea NRRL 2338]
MAKSQFPVMQASAGPLGKVIRWLFGIAAVVLVVRYPGEAATWVQTVLAWLGSAVEGIVTFLRAVGG